MDPERRRADHARLQRGFATRLIGSPETVVARVEELRSIGVEMLHLAIGDELFEREVLPVVTGR